jgi:AbrB family looped-hinge helix DNA binding protein
MKPEESFDECYLGAATVGERGQIVIPAEARKRYSIHAGDKLLVLAHPGGNGLVLAKMDAMREFFSTFLDHLTRVEEEMSKPEKESRE